MYYLITDDTKHGKHDTRHAVLRTGVYPDGKPRYIVLTSSAAVTKDAKGNADLNQQVLKKLVHPDILPFLGGGTVDNAGSARAEIKETNAKLMAHLKEIGQEDLTKFFGVPRETVVIPDFFHIDNIAIEEASSIFSGDPERGNFAQFHPRQFLWSIYDIHVRDPELSQQIIDKVLSELPEKVIYILKPLRDRPQRWRLNGLNSMRLGACKEDCKGESR